ncbi:hypothetical protein VNO80_26586 [Phaseolus coccineus]|uniref:Uncharacterized protein n=1 Tax=Phaseolus coccineus TaxID=3886 RepID=A0AAN9QEJ9_PHACN
MSYSLNNVTTHDWMIMINESKYDVFFVHFYIHIWYFVNAALLPIEISNIVQFGSCIRKNKALYSVNCTRFCNLYTHLLMTHSFSLSFHFVYRKMIFRYLICY